LFKRFPGQKYFLSASGISQHKSMIQFRDEKDDAYSRVKGKAPGISGIEYSAAGTHSNISC
jgi:hypothetical protein